MKKGYGVVVISLAIMLAGLLAQAQNAASTQAASSTVPRMMKFNGTATNAEGKAMSGVAGITFSIYKDQQGGAALWMETQNVALDGSGHYSVFLGATKPDGLPKELFTSGEARWVGVQVHGQADSARVLLLSVPYALKAADAETIGGLPPSAFVLASPASGASTAASSTAASSSAASGSGSSSGIINTATPTGSGTAGTVPVWTSSTNLGNSKITEGAGGASVNEPANLPSTGTATSLTAFKSQPLNIFASSFNSTTSTAISQHWVIRADGTNNNTPGNASILNILTATGSGTPASRVQIFPSGRVVATAFTGDGKLVTNVNAALLGGLAPGAFAQLGAASNAFTGSMSVAGNFSSGGTISGNGSGLNSVNAAALGGLGPGAYAQVAAANIFGPRQQFNGGLLFGAPLQAADGNTPLLFNGVSCCTGNSRMLFAENPSFNTWGIFYDDVNDRMSWQNNPGSQFVTMDFFAHSLGVRTNPPVVALDVGSGAIAIDDANGGLWFKTTNLGSVDTHHMLFGSDNTASKQESLAIYHCNNTPTDTAVSSCIAGAAGTEAFRFQWNGFAFAANSWNAGGVDVAEKYPNFAPGLEAGDVVMLDTNSGSDFKLLASTAPYQDNVLGVVSEKPGVVLGGSGDKLEDAKGLPVALNGRVPVKVTLENGPIHAGDYLTSSSRPGHAMKATKSGRVIGIALTSFGSDSDSASATGKLIVFVNAHHWENGEEMRQLRAEIETLKGELASRDQQVRELRSEFNQFRQALGVQKAAMTQP